jgi:hypothetical protein
MASGTMSNGKLKNLRFSDATVQKHVARFEVGLFFERDALVAAVLNDEVMILARASVVPIDGDRGLNGTVRQPAFSNRDSLRFATACVLPEGKKVLCVVPRVGTEIEMPAQTELADLGQDPSVLKQAVPLRWRLWGVCERPFCREPGNQAIVRGPGRGGIAFCSTHANLAYGKMVSKLRSILLANSITCAASVLFGFASLIAIGRCLAGQCTNPRAVSQGYSSWAAPCAIDGWRAPTSLRLRKPLTTRVARRSER